MKRPTILIAICTLLLLATPASAEENVKEIFKKVDQYLEKKNYPKALEELEWARKSIEKKHATRIGEFIQNEVLGFKGEPAATQTALGILSVEKNYRKGAQELTLTLSGGSSAAGGGMANIAALGKMAAMFGGNQPGMETFRIKGRTANLEVDKYAKQATLTIFLESGSILKLELPQSTDGATLRKIGESFKLVELDEYLAGKS